MWILGFIACGLESSPAPDRLEFNVEDTLARGVSGIALTSLAAPPSTSSSSSSSDTGDTGGDSGLDTGSASTACLAEDLSVELSAAATGGAVWVYSPPLLDLRPNPTAVDRPARLLVYDAAGGCSVHTRFSDADSLEQATGFGRLVDGDALIEPAGLMPRLVETPTELWLFFNSAGAFWRVDPTTGAETRDASLGWVTGAIADGAGGAWVATAPRLSAGGGSASSGELIQLAPLGVPLSRATLPFTPASTGFAAAVGSQHIPMFLSNDLALDGADLYVLDSETGELALLSGGAFTVYSLGLSYPTGIAWQDGTLVVASGLEADSSGAVLTAPALHSWTASGGAVLELTLPAPADGWRTQGFQTEISGGRVVRDAWFELRPIGSADLLVADSGHGRVVLVR